jgi:hypothetical protein
MNRIWGEGIEVKLGEVHKGFAGTWWRHDIVTLHGKEIGFFQVRRVFHGKRIGHRIEGLTADMGNACVVGCHLDWLLRRAGARAALRPAVGAGHGLEARRDRLARVQPALPRAARAPTARRGE